VTHRRPSIRRRATRLLQLGLVGTWLAVALALPSPMADDPRLEMLAAPSGNPLGLSNSKNGVAVLGASNMRPGDTATGTVTLTNTGNVDSDLSLQKTNLRETAGPGGGVLSEVLQLQVQNVTKPTPVILYNGRLATMPALPLGAFPKKAAGQTYRFTVTLPSSAGDRYEQASTRVDYVWTQTKSNGNGPKNK
jgi:spore coat-associated protein N